MAATRRQFLQGSLALGTGLMTGLPSFAQESEKTKTTQVEPEGFFTLGQQKNHWWLITPEGKPFFTMGINHIDPASLALPGEHRHLARKSMAAARFVGLRIRRAQLEGLGIQHSRMGAGGDCQTVAAFTCLYHRRIPRT